jgi:hypothetical protein
MGILPVDPKMCGVRKEYFSTLQFKNQHPKKEKKVIIDTHNIEDLQKYQGDDIRGEYICPDCEGVLYCVGEAKGGDPVYQCQQCQNECIVW